MIKAKNPTLKSTSKKLPRKFKQWEQDILLTLSAATLLNQDRYYGIFIAEDDPSQLARDRDAFTALGIMQAFMHRNITHTNTMLKIRLEVYRKLFDELKNDIVNHPGEMFVSAYLYTHVPLNLISLKKYEEIAALFSEKHAEQLGWNQDSYTPTAFAP